MPRTVIEVRKELNTVNAAIQELISGKKLKELRVGSGDFARLYQFQEVSLENLRMVRDELVQELAVLEGTDELIFRKNCNIPLVVTKFRR